MISCSSSRGDILAWWSPPCDLVVLPLDPEPNSLFPCFLFAEITDRFPRGLKTTMPFRTLARHGKPNLMTIAKKVFDKSLDSNIRGEKHTPRSTKPFHFRAPDLPHNDPLPYAWIGI
jgi:hypothetical protein